jgi:zinc/manganese transport system substrate-binding protein
MPAHRIRGAGYPIALLLAAVVALLPGNAAADSKIKIVTSTQDLASLAQEVGGDRVEVNFIGRGYQDPHFVEPKPSFLLLLRHADLLISVGLQLEIGWLPPLINQSGNPKIQVSAGGNIEAAQFAEVLELPTGVVTRAMGDVHPLGNPHFWLDPENGLRIARGIAGKLVELRPADAAYFQQRVQDFQKRLEQESKKWDEEMKPYRGRKVITYHRSWPNFLKRFQLVSVGEIEPRPGIPPSPSHTIELINMMRRDNVKIILVEPYFDLKTPESIARETGGKVVVLPPSVGGEKEITDYFKLFDYDLGRLIDALQATK